jgi:alpha-tubulin suppressor-like RCC1 family protein
VCWGHNGLGQLGNGAGTDSLAPVAVSGVTNATDLSVGAYTSCVVRATGTVSCWGDNSYGKVGDGTTALRLSPVAVSGLTGAAEVSAGPSHTCARTTAGQVYCWGDNSQGQLGDGTISVTPRLAPGLVPGIADATDLAVGDGFTCVRRSSGQVWCWGENTYGELGSGATSTPRATPGAVVGLTDGVAVVAGGYHACALRATGRVVCWGENGSGQLGAVTVPADRSATPVVAPLPALDAVELATGTAHTCARRSGGTVYCWGYNGNGQVGDGTLVSRTAPVVVPTGGVSAQVGLGDLHSCAALDTGALMCWGNNANGRLGDGTTVDRALPVAVLGL